MRDRLAIIGCGAAATWNHVPALKRTGWDPKLFVDPDLDRAVELSRPWGAQAVVDYTAHLDEFDAGIGAGVELDERREIVGADLAALELGARLGPVDAGEQQRIL